MRPANISIAREIKRKLISFDRKKHPMPGIQSKVNLNSLVEQIIDSIKRVKYIRLIRNQDVSAININVTSNLFDPLKGAVWYMRRDNLDEAFWLIFIATHFGKNLNSGWRLARDVYGGLSNEVYWNWERVVSHIGEFKEWLDENQVELKLHGKFGNHRKYESISGSKERGTGAAFESYVQWVGDDHQHEILISNARDEVGDDPREMFNYLYNTMNVMSFGRTAKFDYLTMIGKMGLAGIVPGSTYLDGATGPLRGAHLLFGSNKKKNELAILLGELEIHLELYFGMQVLEDSLCNWQKSPAKHIHFRG